MRKRLAAGTGISLGAIIAVPAAAQAEDFTVTNLNDSGSGSLRQAVLDANADNGADRILFNSKLSGTIELNGDRLSFYGGDVDVIGPGARKVTVDAEGASLGFLFYGDYFLAPPSDATLSGLTVTGGDAYAGAGVDAYGADIDLTVSRATISGNDATGKGGGVYMGYDAGNRLVIDSSTISGNSAPVGGGGVYVREAAFSIRNSTISGNSADGDGGGIAQLFTDQEDTEVVSSTVTGNHADSSGGGIYENSGGAQIRGSIVAGNTATDASQYPDLDDGDWPISFSLIGDVGDAQVVDDGGNLLNVDPLLKPLANNGGPTDTHAFKKSPAKNAGPSDAPDKDQRGAPRKGQPDIGAYELTKCKGVVVNRVGTSGKDKLKGTKKKDGMLGLGGNDKLKGKKGRDGLCGGRGKDKLIGGPGKDKFNGGPGKDKEIQ